MNSYKGFSYPTLREFYNDEEKYTYSKDDTKWSYIMGGVEILIDKNLGSKEVDDLFKNFIDVRYEDIKKITSAYSDVINTTNQKNKEMIDKAINNKVEDVSKKLNINIEDLSNATKDTNTLSDEQLQKIVDAFEENKENNEELKMIADLPSNNGVEERDPEDIAEEGEFKDLKVKSDPDTGIKSILGDADDLLNTESFDELLEKINNNEIEFGNSTIETVTEEEVSDYLSGEHPGVNEIIDKFVTSDYPLSKDSVKIIMNITNRRLKNEEFNVYKELPNEIKTMIDNYVSDSLGLHAPMSNNVQVKIMKKRVAEALIDDFSSNIQLDRISSDFGKEVEDIFSKNAKDVSDSIIGYSKNKIESYRKSLDNITDPDKKERLSNILDRIDDAYNLDSLKEFSKKCKIKKFDLEKPYRFFDDFARKYEKSTYDAFSIKMIIPILFRHLNENPDERIDYDENHINAFLIAFCKQVSNYSSSNILEHSYMYFVTYNIALLDINVSETTKDISSNFLNNIKEVIDNLTERNKGVL